MKRFSYQKIFDCPKPKVRYDFLGGEFVKTETLGEKKFLIVSPKALEFLAREAFRRISFLLRPAHQAQVAGILSDPSASRNDKFIAWCMLENAAISSEFVLPFCQDTGTATVIARKGEMVITGANDEKHISKGIRETYVKENLRYSQVAPLSMYREKNTGDNLPAQIDIYACEGGEYEFLFMAKGGGSANKTALFQETKAILAPEKLVPFLIEKMKSLGTAACPPYHIAFVVGGASAEMCLKTVKLATAGYYDNLPASGNERGRAFRDRKLEKELLKASRKFKYGAQFGGKYFAHDVKVIRLPRHGASCPIGIGVSCSADRNALAKINEKGLWIEKLEKNPASRVPRKYSDFGGKPVKINLERPIKEILKELSRHKIGTQISLTGKIVVARDMAHARFAEMLGKTGKLPQYLFRHPVYYAGPAKKPAGKPSGSFGPTTAGRMDPYVPLLQAKGASMIMIAKGNRSKTVTDSCKKYGGFYLGSPGGPAALLAERHIKKVETIDFPELGMEAVWLIEVRDFPAFILVDDKGNDFFAD